MLYFFQFLSGISETGKYHVAYVYAVEIVKSNIQSQLGVIMFIAFSMSKLILCLSFYFVKGQSWIFMAYLALILAGISLIITYFFMPESPRFYYKKGQIQKSNEILEQMGKINNAKFEFDNDY